MAPLWHLIFKLMFLGNPVLAAGPSYPEARSVLVRQNNQPCSTWELSPEAWAEADTDSYLAEVFADAEASGERFDTTLGKSISHINFLCRIAADSCAVTSCTDFDNSTQYYAAVGLQTLNSLFNVMYDGTVIGQLDATNLADDLADKFLRWRDPLYLGAAIAYAIDATITAICTFGLATIRLPQTQTKTFQGVEGIQYVAGGAAGVVADFLRPLSSQTRDSGIRELNDMFYYSSNTARQAIENLADSIFSGKADNNSNTILDYLRDGAFIYHDVIPPMTQVENYYKTSLVARTVNQLYRETRTYVVSTTADPQLLHSPPSNSSWTSPSTGRTFILYSYHDDRVQTPPGLNVLNGSYYGIHAWQLAKSSGWAWEVAGNNYSHEVSQQQLLEAFDASSNYTPFQDQAGWQGMSTLPVCDVGDHFDWVVPYGSHTLPCCCGPDCKDTRAFIQLANLNHTEGWYYRCRDQLSASNLDFDSIDYGIDLGSAAHQFWHQLGMGGKAGFIIGVIFGTIVFLFILIACCSCCCD